MYLLGVFITNSHLLKADISKEELIQILEALILKIKLSKFMNHFESGEIKQSCWSIFVTERKPVSRQQTTPWKADQTNKLQMKSKVAKNNGFDYFPVHKSGKIKQSRWHILVQWKSLAKPQIKLTNNPIWNNVFKEKAFPYILMIKHSRWRFLVQWKPCKNLAWTQDQTKQTNIKISD